MTTFFGYKRLVTVDDWRGLAGDNNWPTRSASHTVGSSPLVFLRPLLAC
jgi:hypothetical protein